MPDLFLRAEHVRETLLSELFPPLPSWESAHPIVVHFPIGLLLVAPLLVILGLILRPHERGLFIAALSLMVVGTLASWIAVETGEATAGLGVVPDEGAPILERHAQLAENARSAFTVLTLAFGALVLVPMIWKKDLEHRLTIGLAVGFLLFYGAACLLLVNASHAGGRLVHEFGTTAWM